MNVEDFKKMMDETKEVDNEEVSVLDKREKAMQDYLADVAPISEYINNGFKEIEAKKLAKKDKNQ